MNPSSQEITEKSTNDRMDSRQNAVIHTSDSISASPQHTDKKLVVPKQIMGNRDEDLAASLALLNATLESTADGIVATDLNGRVISYNSKFADIWQLPEEFLATGSSAALIDRVSEQVKDEQQFRQRIQELELTPEVEALDVIELKNGRAFERYRSPQWLGDQCVGVVVNFRDITVRKKAEEALARFAAIVDSSDDAIISKTLEGIITSWNKGATRIFGYSEDEMIGKPVLTLIPHYLHHEETMILSRLRKGERIEHFETIRVKKNGDLVNISLTVSPIRDVDNKVIGVSKIARDISDRKHSEAEREELLKRETVARMEAEAANRARDEFLAVVSHELRTPLNAMMGWSELLMMKGVDEASIKQGLEIIHRNVRLQSRLVDDLLDVSRIITGKMNLNVECVQLERIVLDAIEVVRSEADSKCVQLNAIIEPGIDPLPGDPQRLQQCVWNLLSNAVKFTPIGGEVLVRLTSSASTVSIQVQDTGIGIHPDFLPHAFDRLRQADSSASRGGGGLGLGLSIVRHIVELHGGTITADSAGQGQGATFTIILPLQPNGLETTQAYDF